MVDHVRFGHTFDGSFGFTLESPLIGAPSRYIQSALTPDINDLEILPLERRVLERIIRGLLVVREATSARDVDILVKDYMTGLNANMCEAIINMSQDQERPIEYSVIWSRKLRASVDVGNRDSIKLNRLNYEFLERASIELRRVEPEYQTIRGLVTILRSDNDPLGTSVTDRSVVIKWERPRGRPVNVYVVLERDDYVKALDAHRTWSTVEVTGVLSRTGSARRLSDPQDFKVINPR